MIRKRLDYWTFAVGPKFSKEDRRAAKLERSYFVHQVEYCRNFIFKKHHPIRKLFERSCELGLWRLTGDKIVEIFGRRSRERLSGRLETVLHRIEHGAHVFRAYWKHAVLKQYEKYARFLRNELTSNNLRDFGLKKGLAELGAVREKFLGVLERFAGVQAENLNVHEDFALIRRLALPVQQGKGRVPGIRIQDMRAMRLLEVLLHSGTVPGGWSSAQIHEAVQKQFRLGAEGYRISSLRYDLRKLKGHGLVERVAGKYAYRLTAKGQQAAILFLLFHKWLSGPVAGSRFCGSRTRSTGRKSVNWRRPTTERTKRLITSWPCSKRPSKCWSSFVYEFKGNRLRRFWATPLVDASKRRCRFIRVHGRRFPSEQRYFPAWRQPARNSYLPVRREGKCRSVGRFSFSDDDADWSRSNQL